jgi:hypothetical protein
MPLVCSQSKDFPLTVCQSWSLDDVAATTQDDAAPSVPIIKATVTAVQQTDMAKAIKDEINKFSEGMPIFLNALDELKSLHPFIGGEFEFTL